MAKKTVGKEYWIGAANGSHGYFVKYCPKCNESIYLGQSNGEFEEFFRMVKYCIPSLFKIAWNKFKGRIRIPRIKIEWASKNSIDIVELSDRIELHNIDYPNNKIDKEKLMDRFNKGYFDKKYKAKGGFKKLKKMIDNGIPYRIIAEYFGLRSRSRIGQYAQAIREGSYTTRLNGDHFA